MTNFKCPYCDRYLSSRQAYSQHVNKCIKIYIISSDESNNDTSDINDMSLDNEDLNQIEGLPEENLLESYKFEEDENPNIPSISQEGTLDNTGESNNFSEDYDIDQSKESDLEDFNNFEVSPNYEESNDQLEEVTRFPNEAYADLMELVIKHNLNNKAGNSIIKFFNKHSNLSTSPLPKNIETGRKLMDLMNIQNLSYSKHCILVHNNKEYFIHYRPIKNCIENLLANPDIIKNFIFKYQSLQVIIYYLYYLYY